MSSLNQKYHSATTKKNIYRKQRNISVQKIWRFRQNPPKMKYWQIFNLEVLQNIQMTIPDEKYNKVNQCYGLCITVCTSQNKHKIQSRYI